MSENARKKEEDTTGVRVAVRVRPQLAREKIDMCQVCISVSSDQPQITVGKDKAFTYDYVFDMDTSQDAIYNNCVRGLIDGCFEGYNATVFAYGQTGSGKTYSMGTGFEVDSSPQQVGIIPRAVDHLFTGIEERTQTARENCEPLPDFKVNAQFMELYNEEILDLLDTTRDPEARTRKSNIKIHEDAEGGIYVVGVTTRPVSSLTDTIECLKQGALSRATASTNMNTQSSRSHAIFTLHIRQQRMVKNIEEEKDEDSTQPAAVEFETLTAKFHFVDLAGSERLKRTGATGDRAKEGISINCGLLALGNVISALGDVTKKATHVPYRDSKITRLLQDSLGGNSRTLMIACVSPSDRDFVETLNTLKYANRARNIKNKVVSNQDKTSKQLAALRAEIAMLQQELCDYKQGKRVIDADGVESVNDMFHENTMLQTENNKLRSRIKALYETVETVKARNSQLLLQVEAYKLTGGTALEIGNEEVSKVLEEYIKQTEDLRTKLAESEAQCEVLQKASVRSPSRLALSPMSRSFSAVPISGGMDTPLSPDHNVAHLLEEAKKDIKKLKKAKKNQSSKQSNAGSDKENFSDEDPDDQLNDAVENQGEVVNGLNGDGLEESDIDEDDDDDEDVDEDSSSEEEDEDQDSDNIHEDLAELTCEISIKQKLIDELEMSQKKLHTLRIQYEEKLTQLQAKIRETEIERDTVLANLGQVESTSADKAKKIKEQFEKKLSDLQNEAKKMQAAKKEHAKLVKNQSHYEKQLKTLQHEMGEMKKTKVRLMKQIKEESEKNKQSEARRSKEMAQLKKDQRLKENKIRTLEAEKRQKETVLRRKQEEVESLRKRQKPMSQKAAGRVGKYIKPPTIPIGPMSSTPMKRRRNITSGFSAKMAKQKWDTIEKNVASVITRRQTISHMEKDMENWMKHREKLGKKLEKLIIKRDGLESDKLSKNAIKDLNDMVESVKTQIDYAQENISECQNHIMQMEETKEDVESVDLTSLVNTCTLAESRYLIDHLLQLAITKGLALAQKDSDNRELCAKLHQTELNNTLQQDLLRHMMADQVDIEVDNLLTNNDETESATSSTSSSPVDSMLDSQSAPAPPRIGIIPTGDNSSRKEKARRKTATPQELLFAGDAQSDQTAPPLSPLVESSQTGGNASAEQNDVKKTNGFSESNLMLPPKTLPLKPAVTRLTSGSQSSSKLDINSASMLRGRSSTDSLSSSDRNSLELPNSRDSTPPTSPMGLRRSLSRGNNVFSRLTNSNPSSPHPNRGSITPTGSGKNLPGRLSPLVCTHTAEGHTKAVLSVYATEDMLFSSSKDRTAKAWDLQTGKELLSFPGHPNNVVKVKYSEGTQLAFTVSLNCINVWDTREKPVKCVKNLNSSGLTSDSSVTRSGGRQVGLPMGEHQINDIALNSDGTTLYSASGNMVRVWDLRKFSAVGKLSGGHAAPVMVLALDELDSKDLLVTGSKDHYIKIFEVPAEAAGVFTPKYNLEPPHYDGIQSLAIQGHTLFSGSRDTCIKKWDLGTHQLKQSVNAAHKDWICALALLPSGDILLSGCRTGYLKLWQVDTCSPEGEIKAHTSPINAIATNSTSIFTASNDNTVAIWKQKSSLDPSDSSDVTDDRSSES
ncbi:kinesin-like protein KIF21A isoform X2 [Liolophura sinensis]|uniref:kinesin-like protein KIF21A isoform X2 n=1 Tax=Liolophura sinensis TaxID=3198878 RepID=UPI003158FD3A